MDGRRKGNRRFPSPRHCSELRLTTPARPPVPDHRASGLDPMGQPQAARRSHEEGMCRHARQREAEGQKTHEAGASGEGAEGSGVTPNGKVGHFVDSTAWRGRKLTGLSSARRTVRREALRRSRRRLARRKSRLGMKRRRRKRKRRSRLLSRLRRRRTILSDVLVDRASAALSNDGGSSLTPASRKTRARSIMVSPG